MNPSLETYFKEALNRLQEEHMLRTLPEPANGMIDFTSNHYLGLHCESRKMDEGNPRAGSRLLAGNHQLLEEAELFFASFLKAEKALLFNSGYTANVGFWSTVPTKNDWVLFDRGVHASIRDGLRLGYAKTIGFEHISGEDLKLKLERINTNEGRIFIAVESVYSMDGDLCPLEHFCQIAEDHGAILVVDEAHGVGTSFPSGKGWVVDLGLEDRIPFRLVTLGKGLGLHGALWLGSENFCRFLLNKCRPFIYTTALPPGLFNLDWQLWEGEFKKALDDLHLNLKRFEVLEGQWISAHPHTPIKHIPCGSSQKALDVQDKLKRGGIRAQAVRYPTVALGEERVRICIRADHQLHELEHLKKLLEP